MYIFIMLLCLVVSALFSLYKQFQMLQQNSYFPSRYYKWLSGSYSPTLAICSILFCALSFLWAKSPVVCAVLGAIVLIVRIILAINSHKKSIKPLVFTKRVWRLYVCALLSLLALLACYLLITSKTAKEIFLIIAVCLSCVTSLLCLLSWVITLPIEKAFARHFVNDAKRILKENPNITVVGITGSYGKTTTKFILNRILSEKFNTVCTPQSFNTPMGVVRTIRESVEAKTQVFICEMGAKNIGDIKEICDIVNPKYGIITSVGPQHLETFKSCDNVFKTKFELADAVANNNGVCFANIDSAEINLRTNTRTDVVYFGQNTDYYIKNIVSDASGSRFDLVLKGDTVPVHTKLLGAHSLLDILAAAAVAYTLGVSASDIAFAVSSLKPTEHRLQLKPFYNGSLVIDDAYNSNPEGCLEAVRVIGLFEGFKKTVITPGLIELGDKEYECNYKLGEQLTKYADRIILVGKNRSKPMIDAIEKTDFDKAEVFVVSSFKEGLEIFTKSADSNSVLLIENDLPDNYLN